MIDAERIESTFVPLANAANPLQVVGNTISRRRQADRPRRCDIVAVDDTSAFRGRQQTGNARGLVVDQKAGFDSNLIIENVSAFIARPNLVICEYRGHARAAVFGHIVVRRHRTTVFQRIASTQVRCPDLRTFDDAAVFRAPDGPYSEPALDAIDDIADRIGEGTLHTGCRASRDEIVSDGANRATDGKSRQHQHPNFEEVPDHGSSGPRSSHAVRSSTLRGS